ncbi:eukaryotic porin/Tom40 [Paraphysoderma sedebokerense]|nr:eukaryotic porin/Tom40 [Paraphysoderma sedebokerense]
MTASFLTKVQTQLGNQPGQSMLQVEADYSGTDYTANIKAVNPSPFDNTGIFVASYLQSVTPSLAVGIEGLYQRPMEDVEETGLSFVAKYTFAKHELKTLQPLNPTDPIPQPPTANPVLTATLQSFGALQLTYFHPVSSKVELASELQVLAAPGRREAVASVGAKFDFRTATVRNMLDTTGKISTVLEQKMAPGFSFLISGEIDHLKGASRFGVGLALEM